MNVLPNGCFNIAIVIGQGVLVSLKEKEYRLHQGIYLCSQFTEPVNLIICKHTKVISIQIHAWYFSYLPKVKLSNFTNEIVENESNAKLFNDTIDLNSTSILEEVIKHTEKYFSHFKERNPEKNMVEQIALEILSKKGDCTIANLIESKEYSERWLQIKFKKSVGLTPKQYAKIIQFRDTVNKMVYHNSSDSLTSIGALSGYSDQSHFIKNFYNFTGIIPSKFNPEKYFLSFDT